MKFCRTSTGTTSISCAAYRCAPARSSYPALPCGWGMPETTCRPFRFSSIGSAGTIPLFRKSIQPTRFSGNRPRMPCGLFKEIFGLPVDGIVGSNTWYRIAYLYTAVKRLSELDSEGFLSAKPPASIRVCCGRGHQHRRAAAAVLSGRYQRVLRRGAAGAGDRYL